jgi:hypothetical protein
VAAPASLRLEDEHRGWLGIDRARRRRRLLGLERLQRAQRAHELGHRRAAVAHQSLERSGAIAVADHAEAKIAAGDATLLEQLDLDPLRSVEPPGGARDAPDQDALQGALRRQLVLERFFQGGELAGILVREHHVPHGPQAVLQRIP